MQLFMFTGEKEYEYGKQGRRHTRIGRRCMRCGTDVPRSKDTIYWQSEFCGWCYHMYQKLLQE